MDRKCFYQIKGKEFGPILSSELISLAKMGKLSANDMVRPENSDQWIAAGRIRDLMFGTAGNRLPAARTVMPSPVVPLNWVIGGGGAVVFLFIVVLVAMQSVNSTLIVGNSAPSISKNVPVPLWVRPPNEGNSAPAFGENGSSSTYDSKSQREKAMRAEVESLRFEITQMQIKERDLQRQTDELDANKRRAEDDLRRVRDPVNNQSAYFAIMSRSQNLTLESISKAVKMLRLQEDILQKQGKLAGAESTLRSILNP